MMLDVCFGSDQGPVNNIIDNAKESARAISCTASLTFNHSKELLMLLHKPFQDAFEEAGVRLNCFHLYGGGW